MAARTMQSKLGALGNEPDFYTVGYERLPLNELFILLKAAGVHCLIDVREAPWSQVPEYRKAELEDLFPSLGASNGHEIKYVSMPSLGNPPENRKSDRPVAEMRAYYRQHLLSRQAEIETLGKILKSCRSALMCYELDPRDCHRSVLAAVLAEKYSLEYTDLRD